MNITVYCGASEGKRKDYLKDAVEIGKWIGKNNHSLVYGAGDVGLMGRIADTVLEVGGKAIGVIPYFLIERELMHEGLTEVYKVETMAERKTMMMNMGDCYLALPGGIGTLEEIIEVFSLAKLGQNPKPCIFYNSSGYYNQLESFLFSMVKEGFLTKAEYDKLLFAKSIEEVDSFIQSYTPPMAREYV